MQPGVLGRSENFQVLRAIVGLVSVAVMDNFPPLQLPPKHFACHHPMLGSVVPLPRAIPPNTFTITYPGPFLVLPPFQLGCFSPRRTRSGFFAKKRFFASEFFRFDSAVCFLPFLGLPSRSHVACNVAIRLAVASSLSTGGQLPLSRFRRACVLERQGSEQNCFRSLSRWIRNGTGLPHSPHGR